MARPGNVEIHQAFSKSLRPSATIEPQEGVGGWRPNPKKDNPASRTITFPMPSVAATITGAKVFGITWRKMMRSRVNPRARAASMNSRSRRLSTSPRTIRVVPGHWVKPRTAMIKKIDDCSKRATMVMSSTRRGKEITMSTKRMTTASTFPPRKPAIAPSIVPIVMLIPTATKPIARETRAP